MAKERAKRILIVEDAGIVRLYYREILEGAGYNVEEALNGLEAMEKLFRQAADLVIVDINMPQMDGVSFLKLLRRQAPPLCSTPALVASTESDPNDMSLAQAAGANFYLIKPTSKEMLLRHAALMMGIAS